MGDNFNDDAVIGHSGVEIITPNGPNDSVASAVYPHFANKLEHSSHAHAAYSVLEDEIGGLIGDEPHSADRWEENPLGIHTVDPTLGETENSGGAIAKKEVRNVPMHNVISKGHNCEGNIAVAEVIGEKVDIETASHSDGSMNKDIEKGKFKIVPAGIQGSALEYLASWPPPAPNMMPGSRYATQVEKDKDVAALLAAFLSLPREELLRAMISATSIHGKRADKAGVLQHTCTGCGTWDEQCKTVGNTIPTVAVAS
jgi:hypothetical protein